MLLCRWLHLALLFDEVLKLEHPRLFDFNDLLSVLMDSIIGVELLLKLDYGLVALIKSACQSDHDVSLLQQELLVSVDLGLVFLDLSPLALHVLELLLILLPDELLLLLEQGTELRGLLDFLAANEHLGVEGANLLLETLLLFFLLVELSVSLLQGVDGRCLVLFGSALLLLELD